jgi:hypothetical protein
MSTNTVYCYVLKGNVTVVSDLNGNVTNVICPKFVRVSHGCLIKSGESGFISGTLKKVADNLLGTKANSCEFTDPNESLINKTVRRR